MSRNRRRKRKRISARVKYEHAWVHRGEVWTFVWVGGKPWLLSSEQAEVEEDSI